MREYDPYVSVIICAGRSGVDSAFLRRWCETGPREKCPEALIPRERRGKRYMHTCVRCGSEFEARTRGAQNCDDCCQQIRIEASKRGTKRKEGYHATSR